MNDITQIPTDDVMYKKQTFEQAHDSIVQITNVALSQGMNVTDPKLDQILKTYLVQVGWIPEEFEAILYENIRKVQAKIWN